MMNEEIIIAGFGGQGILSLGKFMAYSGIMQNLEVSWMPSYGPEMRGGTANVTVILSEERISSPILTIYTSGIILNQQSIVKFEPAIQPGGILVYETNGIAQHPSRNDLSIYKVAATEEAVKMSSPRTVNMIMLGAYLKVNPILSLENVEKGLEKSLPERHHHLISVNMEALRRGMEIVQAV